LDALCPVWGARSEYLRADAAHAFDRLSTMYARTFGRPICITDTYRSYADQVRVRAQRPGLAALPGHSNHGWGTAADLCGGIESFSADPHRWMLIHAPLYGWFHPAWAEPTGTLPEPWHWEYGG
jgi:LAS superfamily LD-carboxypeptidase LdcB